MTAAGGARRHPPVNAGTRRWPARWRPVGGLPLQRCPAPSPASSVALTVFLSASRDQSRRSQHRPPPPPPPRGPPHLPPAARGVVDGHGHADALGDVVHGDGNRQPHAHLHRGWGEGGGMRFSCVCSQLLTWPVLPNPACSPCSTPAPQHVAHAGVRQRPHKGGQPLGEVVDEDGQGGEQAWAGEMGKPGRV